MWPALAILLALPLAALLVRSRRRHALAVEKISRLEREALAAAETHRRALEELAARQDTLFNSMVGGLLVLDATGRIQLANRALLSLTNSTADIRGKTVLEAFRVHALNDLAQRISGGAGNGDIEVGWPGLPPRHLQVNAAAILGADGKPRGSVLIFHDLTRLKQLENTRQEFVANVSHELRTPLSLIKGYVETLLDGAKDDPEVAARFLQTILKHTDRLACLIEDLLTLSQLESGRATLDFQTADLRSVAGRVTEDLNSRALTKQIALRNEIPPDLAVHADASRLQQVFFNLVDNGIKYGVQGGFVELGARQTGDGGVEAWVRDNGAGIPSEACERIFERFYRVDRARSREQGGTGLGLSIVKHLVQSHGGKVWVKSEPGQGSAFHFTLPPVTEPADV
jgi:two-component system phosphate regulon sensor histidine kinase PhoR